MGFQKIDKKQLPQVIGLGVVSAGMFGYFTYKMMAPTVSAAPPPAAAKNVQTAAATGTPSAPAGGAGTAPADPSAAPDAPPPVPGMRDPFIPTITDADAPAGTATTVPPARPVRVASNQGIKPDTLLVPPAPPLPAPGGSRGETSPLPPLGGPLAGAPAPKGLAGGLAPMPVAPSWTVTGVLQGDGGQVAILRSGEVRQFAHRGDLVGGDFRVVDVTRDSVVLRHGSARYTLPLGGAKPVDARPRKAALPSGAFAAGTAAPSLPEQTLDQAVQERQALQDTVTKLGGTPQGMTDSTLTQANSALSQAQELIEKH